MKKITKALGKLDITRESGWSITIDIRPDDARGFHNSRVNIDIKNEQRLNIIKIGRFAYQKCECGYLREINKECPRCKLARLPYQPGWYWLHSQNFNKQPFKVLTNYHFIMDGRDFTHGEFIEYLQKNHIEIEKIESAEI